MLLQSPNVNIFLAGEGQIYRQERKPYQIEEINEDLNEIRYCGNIILPPLPTHKHLYTRKKRKCRTKEDGNKQF